MVALKKYKDPYCYLLRAELADAEKWQRAAKAEGLALVDWVSKALNLRAKFILKLKKSTKDKKRAASKEQMDLVDIANEAGKRG